MPAAGKAVKEDCLIELAAFQADLTTNVNKDIPLGRLFSALLSTRITTVHCRSHLHEMLIVMQLWPVSLMQPVCATTWQMIPLKQPSPHACGTLC